MTQLHVGELKLRRFRAGELDGEEATTVSAHTEGCATCRARLRSFDEEQRTFESEVPFDGFASGVERAARYPKNHPEPRRWVAPFVSIAAGVAVAVLAASPLLFHRPSLNRTKGGAEVVLTIAGAEGQREASASGVEALAPGERVRIGYKPAGHAYVLAISIDERGETSALYPDEGQSVRTSPEDALTYLPNSLEFTGAGTERVIVLLTNQPLKTEEVQAAARKAFERAGGLERMPVLELPGEQVTRTVRKP